MEAPCLVEDGLLGAQLVRKRDERLPVTAHRSEATSKLELVSTSSMLAFPHSPQELVV